VHIKGHVTTVLIYIDFTALLSCKCNSPRSMSTVYHIISDQVVLIPKPVE